MSNQPNILLFCVDQMQSYCLGCNGHPDVKTPHLDALAASGMNFNRGYCNTSVCMPSRATIFTGKTPRQHGLMTNGNRLPEDVPTVTQALADAGYRTHAVGKFHLQTVGRFGGEDPTSAESAMLWDNGELSRLPSPYYGFQTSEFVGGHTSGVLGAYRHWLNKEHPESSAKLAHGEAYYRKGQAYRIDIPAEHHYNHWIADHSIDFLREVDDSENPFFLFSSFPDPHFPFAACRPYSEMYKADEIQLPSTWNERDEACPYLADKRVGNKENVISDEAEMREIMAQTYGMISHVDHNVGRVLEKLEEEGLAENALVLFIADHGEYLGSHGLLRKASWPYESLWRVPFIVRAPGNDAGVCETPVSLLDLTPTLLDYARIDELVLDTRGPAANSRLPLGGQSLRPQIENSEAADHAALVMEYDEDFQTGNVSRLRGIIDGDWKLVTYMGASNGLLFNLADDPDEVTNLWDDEASTSQKARLLELLVDRLAATDRFDQPRLAGA